MNIDVDSLYIVIAMISVTCFGAFAYLGVEAVRNRRLEQERERIRRF